MIFAINKYFKDYRFLYFIFFISFFYIYNTLLIKSIIHYEIYIETYTFNLGFNFELLNTRIYVFKRLKKNYY